MTLSDLPGLGAGDAEAFNEADFAEVSIPESGEEGVGPSDQAHKLPMLGNVTAGSIQKSESYGSLFQECAVAHGHEAGSMQTRSCYHGCKCEVSHVGSILRLRMILQRCVAWRHVALHQLQSSHKQSE